MLFLCALLFCCGNLVASYELNAENEEEIKRSDFPAGFLFGAATSSYQVCISLLMFSTCYNSRFFYRTAYGLHFYSICCLT